MSEDNKKNFIEGLITALANKQAQVDLAFQRTGIRFPGSPFSIEITGTITLSVHMRDLTEQERQAYATRVAATLAPGSDQR